jgi:AraC-like DNA-binding protein
MMKILMCEVDLNPKMRQTNTAGTPPFPCAGYLTHLNYEGRGGEIPWHWHENLEFLLVARGTLKLNISGSHLLIAEGQGCFINSETLHHLQSGDDGECELQSLVFNQQLISGMPESVFETDYVRPITSAPQLPVILLEDEKILEEFKGAFQAFGSDSEGFEWLVREKLSRLWYLMFMSVKAELKKAKSPENPEALRLKKMLDHLHSHYDSPLTLHDLGEAVNISERAVLRTFQNLIGISPMKYLLKHRLSVAAAKLLENGDDITTIGTDCGFETSSYFTKKFKEHFGQTPSTYRKSRN